MGDRTASGRSVVDERSRKLRKRKLEYEIQAMVLQCEKFEIDIEDAEATIARIREDSIKATLERIEKKREELSALSE